MLMEVKQNCLFIDGIAKTLPPGQVLILINEETNQRIPFAKRANTETGEWEALEATPDGKAILKPAKIIRGKNKIRIEQGARMAFAPAVNRTYKPPLTAEEQRAEIRRIALDYGYKEIIAVPGIECEIPGCHQLATYMTGDEQIIDPEENRNGQFERAFTKKVHRFCADCFRPPVQTSIRGVDSEIEVAVRPQW